MKLCCVFDRQNDCDDLGALRFSHTTTVLKILVVVLIGVLALPSLASRCIWGSLEASFSRADVVVKARLLPGTTHIVSRESILSSHEKVSVVDVLKIWKGESTDTLTIRSETGHTGGYTIPDNKTVILFASFRKRSTTDQNSEEATLEEEKSLLYTWHCSDNVILSDDASSRNIEQKLDRLQQKAEEAHKTQKHRKVLRERIREILKHVDDQPSRPN